MSNPDSTPRTISAAGRIALLAMLAMLARLFVLGLWHRGDHRAQERIDSFRRLEHRCNVGIEDDRNPLIFAANRFGLALP